MPKWGSGGSHPHTTVAIDEFRRHRGAVEPKANWANLLKTGKFYDKLFTNENEELLQGGCAWLREDWQGQEQGLAAEPASERGGVKFLREPSRTWKLSFLQQLLV